MKCLQKEVDGEFIRGFNAARNMVNKSVMEGLKEKRERHTLEENRERVR